MRLIAFVFLWCLSLVAAGPIAPGNPVRFTAPGDGLLHASLLRDYEQVPGNLTVVEIDAAGAEVAWAGEVRSYFPENTQTHPGVVAFRSGRVVKGRTYEARVSLPGTIDFQFFRDQEQSVEAGMSWLLRSADAWLSNQPRHGAVAADGKLQNPEARACVACHITQFSTRGYLTAALNGYAAPFRSGLERVVGRLRENPRPLYGHEGVNWSRVIYSARTVSSRLPVLWSMHREATGSSVLADRELVLGAARYLLLSDECGAGALRAEADGSRPEVSGFEIGLQTVQTFRLAASLEPGGKWAAQAACVEGIFAAAKPANVIDAAWQIVGLKRLGLKTEAAVASLLRWQQSDGRFAMEFSKTAPASDFISYHVLYALAVAGYQGPEVDRVAAYTLRSQRADGSWKGAPEYKGFDTPFRETQFAVMALSELSKRPFKAVVSEPLVSRSLDSWRSTDRSGLQKDLLARLEQEDLTDELAASLDENLSMLREWQRTMRQPADQARVEAALRADSQRQATLLASALKAGSRTVRLRVLTAMARMVGQEGVRHGARVGNDVEAPQVLADAGGALEKAILACVNVEDRELTSAAILAGTAMSDVLTPSFTKAMLRLMPLFGTEILAAYGEGGLVLSRGEVSDPELVALVQKVLEGREPRTLSLVLPMLSALEPGHRFTREPGLTGAMEFLLRDRVDSSVLQAAGVFANIVDGPLMRTQVMEALRSRDLAMVRVAVDVVLDRYLVNPRVVELTLQYLAASRGIGRRMLLDSLDPARLKFNMNQVSAYSPPPIPIPLDGSILSAPFVQDFVLSSLRDRDPQVVAAALDLVRKQDSLRRNGAIGLALAESARNRAVVAKSSVPEEMLDFEFFRQKVQPLLQKPGADGRSCAMCHASNARFPLRGDVQANYRAVAGKVSLLDPVASPLLVKPLLPGVSSDGDVFRTSHNGGQRWSARTGSAEYQVILEWIRGGVVEGK